MPCLLVKNLYRHNLIHAYIGQPLVVAASGSCSYTCIMVGIYECSDTVEQSVISGGSNDKRLTDIDTCNCCTCKVAQYVASREALLRAFMYVLVAHMGG